MKQRWAEVTLGDVVEFPRGRSRVPSGAAPGPVLTFKGLTTTGQFNLEAEVTREAAEAKGMTLIQAGDTVGTNQGHATGWILKKVGFARPNDPMPFVASTLQVFRPIVGKVDPRFVHHYLAWPETHRRITDLAGPRTSFTPRMFSEVPFPLPPLEEQQRIAAILDKADDLLAKRRAAIAHLDSLTQAIFTDMFGVHANREWERPAATLGELADVSWGNTSLTKASYTEQGIPAYSASGPDGLVATPEHDGEGIVLSAIGARCGRTFYVAGGPWTAIKNTITIRPRGSASPVMPFLYCLMQRDSFWPRRGGAQPFIALGAAREVRIPQPPAALQEDFARHFHGVSALRRRVDRQGVTTEELASALQARAFRGEL